MKKVLFIVIAALLAAAAVGCNSCGNGNRRDRSWFNWFNRGDSCRACVDGQVYAEEPGMLGTPILNNVPAGPRSNIEVLPGPVLP